MRKKDSEMFDDYRQISPKKMQKYVTEKLTELSKSKKGI